MDCHGRMLAHVLLHESDGIINMSWNCPSFLVEDSTESDTDTDDNAPPQGAPSMHYTMHSTYMPHLKVLPPCTKPCTVHTCPTSRCSFHALHHARYTHANSRLSLVVVDLEWKPTSVMSFPSKVRNVKPLLTVSFISGDISLMNHYDDLSPNVICSGLKGK